MINVLIVDDHALVRMGVRRLLENLPDLKIIGEADNGESALSLIKTHKPDVVLLDIKMPGIDGWEVTRRLKKTNPNIKIIAVTAANSDPMFPARLMQLGAMGYITKESGAEEMALAIHKVCKGEKYLSAEIAQQMAISSLTASEETPFDRISEREMQVMRMITKGMTVSEIAETLFLSTKTVNAYRYRMFEKLGIKNDVELTHLAIKHRILDNPTELNMEDE